MNNGAQRRCRIVIGINIVRAMMTICKGNTTFLRQHGFDVDVVTQNDMPAGVKSVIDERGEFFDTNFIRDLSLLADIKTTWYLFKLFRRRKPDIISLMTLKPGILGAVAGRMAGVPLIIRHKWGNMHECNYRGLKRFLVFSADKLANIFADRVVLVSHKLAESEIQLGAVNPKKAIVYGSGSSNGLDLERFNLTPQRREKGRGIRQQLKIPDSWKVLGTVMRINIEKGICELVEAFTELAEEHTNICLVIIGDYDIRNRPPESILKTITQHPRIYPVGFQKDVENYYAALDVFVMPSYREGFCGSNLEAGGMGLPIIATNIIGCKELIVDGKTGLLVPLRDSKALKKAIERIITDQRLAGQLGKNVRKRIEAEFGQKLVWHNQLRDFCSLLQEKGIEPPVQPEAITGSTCPMCEDNSI